jgi:hypothetical protein
MNFLLEDYWWVRHVGTPWTPFSAALVGSGILYYCVKDGVINWYRNRKERRRDKNNE